jgi:hypothetical protein
VFLAVLATTGLVPATLAAQAPLATAVDAPSTTPVAAPAQVPLAPVAVLPITPAAGVTPLALQALEQKMAQIRFNAARISSRFVLGELGSTAGGAELGSGVGKGKSIVTTGAGSIRFAPYASMFTTRFEVSGEHLPSALASTGQVRTIGSTIYTYTPSAASFDGGRPWVRSTHRPPPKPGTKAAQVAAVLDSLTPALAGPDKGSAGSFATLIDYLGGAVSVREGGSVTVDGQQTTEFTASLSIVKLLAGELSRKQLAKIEREGRAKPSEAIVELEVFLAPDGLPVRTIGASGNRAEGLGIQEDILALEVPFAIHAPPAREAIGQARLLQIERKRDRRRAKQALTRCLRSRRGRACAVREPAAGSRSGTSGRTLSP